MKTIHIEGYGKDIDILRSFSDNYSLGVRFPFEEEGVLEINNVFFRFYECDRVCSLDEAVEGYMTKILGGMILSGQEYGYSEYTIEGFDVTSARIGGHDLQKIFKNKEDKYIHVLIDILPAHTK